MRRSIKKVDSVKVKMVFPVLWRKCSDCGDEIKWEHMWEARRTDLAGAKIYSYCTKYYPNNGVSRNEIYKKVEMWGV